MSSRSYAPLSAYGAIGDGRSVALVGRDGSVDWWCPPRFDAPSVFAGLLDDRTGGFCSVAPAGAVHDSPLWESGQRYLEGTNVLVTESRAADASLRVADVMPRKGGPEILRRVRAEGGPVEAELRFAPRFDYARGQPDFRPAGAGYVAEGPGGEALSVATSEPPPDLEVDGRRREAAARFRVEPGDDLWVALRWDDREASAPEPREAAARLERAAERDRGRDPASLARSFGERDDEIERAVVRSALVVDLLTEASTGAVWEAATTSLPGAAAGGDDVSAGGRDGCRPVDGPDATAVLAALVRLGRREEAGRLCRFLADARRGGGPAGGSAAADATPTLDHLHGHGGHPPDGSGDPPAVPLRERLEEARDLALSGRVAEGRSRIEQILDRAGPAGLLSEAVDPSSGRLRGNLPSASAHAALIDAAGVLLRTPGRRFP